MSQHSDEPADEGQRRPRGHEIDTPMVSAAEHDPDPAEHSELDVEPARSDASGDPTSWDEKISPKD